MSRPRILLVDDDADVSNLMTDLLVGEGYEVVAVRTGESALHALSGAGSFAALVTNYRLPLESGAWLLATASARGLLEGTRAIVLTAESAPQGVEAYRVLHKPVDLDVLLGELARAKRATTTVPPPGGAPLLELALYVTPSSQLSLRARRNLELVLTRFDCARIRVSILELGNPGDATWTAVCDEDRIVVTPTLVKRRPAPRTWVMGDLSNHRLVEHLIRTALEAL